MIGEAATNKEFDFDRRKVAKFALLRREIMASYTSWFGHFPRIGTTDPALTITNELWIAPYRFRFTYDENRFKNDIEKVNKQL